MSPAEKTPDVTEPSPEPSREVLLERRLSRLREERGWSGYLSLGNAEVVADRIRLLIGGGQRYTWVAVNSFFDHRPEVRTSQVAESVTYSVSELHDGRRMAHVVVCDTYGVWAIDTTAPDEASARDGSIHDKVWLDFTCRTLGMELYAPATNHLYWTIALEDEPDSPVGPVEDRRGP